MSVASVVGQIDGAGQCGASALGAVDQVGLEAIEYYLAPPKQLQLAPDLAVQPVDIDVAVAALALDLRPVVIELPIALRDPDHDAPYGVFGITGHQSNRVGVPAQADVDIFVWPVLWGRVAAPAGRIRAPDLDDHAYVSLPPI